MKTRRAIEFVALFVIAPTVIASVMRAAYVFPAIWSLGALSAFLLRHDPTFDRARFWNWAPARAELPRIIIQFAIFGAVLTALLLAIEPSRFLSLPRERPALWGIILVAYPVLSVYSQEVAFRAMVFHRYEVVFPNRWMLIAANAVVFGYAHIILRNWVAIALSTAGGVLFGWTYVRTRSVAACCIEHTLYGWLLFTIGWGSYLYGGSMGR